MGATPSSPAPHAASAPRSPAPWRPKGARLSLLGRDRAALQRVQGELPGTGHGVVVADVTDADSVRAAFEAARGARARSRSSSTTRARPRARPSSRHRSSSGSACWRSTSPAASCARRRRCPTCSALGWGRIVNIASTAGQKGYAYVAAYTAAKHGVVGLTRSLALEVARKGVTVNAVCPGYTDTDILRDSVANVVGKTGRSEADALAEFAVVNPQRRIVQPAEVADAVRWLCGEAAASVTGQSISVSGGEVT